MELRNTELELRSLTEMYDTVQFRWNQHLVVGHHVGTSPDDSDNHPNIQYLLPPLKIPTSPIIVIEKNDDDLVAHHENHGGNRDTNQTTTSSPSTTTATTTTTATEIRHVLNTFQQRMKTIYPIMMKYHQRMQQIDPITQQPRYGIQTKQRVLHMLHSYEALVQVYNIIFTSSSSSDCDDVVDDNDNTRHNNHWIDFPIGTTTPPYPENDDSGLSPPSTGDTTHHHTHTGPNIRTTIHQMAERERLESQQRQERIEWEQQQMILDTEERRRQEQEREEEAVRVTRQQEQDAFRQQTEQLYQQRQMIQAEQERHRLADRLFLQSIPHRNTRTGVQEQLQRFLEHWTLHDTNQSDASSPPPTTTLSVSLKALHTVFQQIVKHPDNEQYRRIRRDHTQFIQDIGQYSGGIELLICAGFTIGMVDNTIPSYICKEPNVETDLDGWSNWYDLLKGTLQLIEQEMIQHGIKH